MCLIAPTPPTFQLPPNHPAPALLLPQSFPKLSTTHPCSGAVKVSRWHVYGVFAPAILQCIMGHACSDATLTAEDDVICCCKPMFGWGPYSQGSVDTFGHFGNRRHSAMHFPLQGQEKPPLPRNKAALAIYVNELSISLVLTPGFCASFFVASRKTLPLKIGNPFYF